MSDPDMIDCEKAMLSWQRYKLAAAVAREAAARSILIAEIACCGLLFALCLFFAALVWSVTP
jgi:hypothetical protein